MIKVTSIGPLQSRLQGSEVMLPANRQPSLAELWRSKAPPPLSFHSAPTWIQLKKNNGLPRTQPVSNLLWTKMSNSGR